MDAVDGLLRLLGAFYVLAGFAATRVALTSYFIDVAIARITFEKPSRRETLLTAWLIGSAFLVLAGGALLLAGLGIALPVFIVSVLGQALYVGVLAPSYFDVEDEPDPAGRRQTRNAFLVYGAVTLLVGWAHANGRFTAWQDAHPLQFVVAAGIVVAHAIYTARHLRPIPDQDHGVRPRELGGDPDGE